MEQTAPQTSSSSPPTDPFLTTLRAHSKAKPRSQSTHETIHLPELNARLNLNLALPPETPSADPDEANDPFASPPDLTNTSKISVVYLGNSMLERLKTTGRTTQLANLTTSWNAGCGGDKNENVLYRLDLGLYSILKQYHASETAEGRPGIRVWVLKSGTNNLHAKKGFREQDVESWRVLVESCLKIAPGSTVLACDVFFRKDVDDGLVERGNQMLKGVVEEFGKQEEGERVKWVEARHLVTKDMLVDRVHLNEEGYRVFDETLWGHVEKHLGSTETHNGEKEVA